MKQVSRFSIIFIFSILSSITQAADTEILHFHVVKDSPKGKLVSNIPKSGYKHNGSVKHSHNPNSIVYQQKELMKRLQAEQEQMDYEAEMELQEEMDKQQQGEESDSLLGRMFVQPDRDIIRESSGKGILEDLIRLEKRGGRAAATTQ